MNSALLDTEAPQSEFPSRKALRHALEQQQVGASRVEDQPAAVVKAQPAAVESTRSKTAWGRVWNALLTLILVVVVALAGVVVVVPRIIGAQALTVLSGSMLPTYRPGDLVVVRPVAVNELQIGDVVTFQPYSGDPTLITHRITSITSLDGEITSITTQGDANNAPDRPLVPGQIMGRVVYSVPFMGHLRTRTGALALSAAMGTGLIIFAVVTILRPDKQEKLTKETDNV